MRKNFDKDAVSILAIVAAAIWGTWLYARQSLQLDAQWTDGSQRFEATSGEGIRHAIWDNAELLGGKINSEANESRPAISPDGRWLVFASGEPGLNVDLWIAEIVGEQLLDARPLDALNSSADDLAPAFSGEALVFASDRGGSQFGLDLWQAAYADGEFGLPEALAGGINTNADETDPFPEPGGTGLVFASNRTQGLRVDFDLYWCDLEQPSEVLGLDPLNTPFDEREPAYSREGTSLYFASNRGGSEGGFDLWRSFNEGFGWLPPQPLMGVNGSGDERGPLPSPDGFSLLFGADDDGQADLWRARSTELFRVPAPPIGAAEIIGLLILILLALLAWMAKRWRGIAVLYRCFLISVCLHLLGLWLLRDVAPEIPPTVIASEEPLFHVRLAMAPNAKSAALEARDGELSVERSSTSDAPSQPEKQSAQANEIAEALPESNALAASKLESDSAPERQATSAPVEPAKSSESTEMRQVDEQIELHAQSSPGMLVVASAVQASPTQTSASEAPGREAAPGVEVQAAAPAKSSSSSFVATRSESDGQKGAPRTRLDTESKAPSGLITAVAAGKESFELADGQGVAMSLGETASFDAPAREGSGPGRQSAEVASNTGGVAPQLEGALAVTPMAARSAPKRGGPGRLQQAPKAVQVAVGESEESSPLGRGDSPVPGLDLASSTQFAAPSRSASGPQRRGPVGSAITESEAAGFDVGRMVAAQNPSEGGSVPGRKQSKMSGAVETDVQLRQESAQEGTGKTKPSAGQPDALGDLVAATSTERRGGARSSLGPRRMAPKTDASSAAAPTDLTLVAAAAPERELDQGPSELEASAYQNRFGDQKLRALDEYGGSTETEAAVERGLQYLASVQKRNGSFGSRSDFDDDKYGDVRVGKTGLALLAFMGAGNSPGSKGKFAANSERAVAYLLGIQNGSNGHFGQGSSYGHGIATYALAECYALTADVELKLPLERAVARILKAQVQSDDRRVHGGWGYYFRDEHIWNRDRWSRTSISSWQLMALESARLGGLEVPDAAFVDAGAFFANAWDSERGAFRYSHDPSRLRSNYAILPASTPASMFGLSLLGVDLSSPTMESGRRFILERSPTAYRRSSVNRFVHEAKGNLYFWYYGTLALFRAGGTSWERWNVAMKDTLLPAQSADGSWPSISSYADYAGDDPRDLSYSTAMNVLTLEIYYRYFTPLLKVR